MPKSILITGCSSGIGLHSALHLAKRGWNVFATVRYEDDLEQLRVLDEPTLFPVFMDLSKPETIELAVKSVLTFTGGRLDALFNNAGYGQPGAVEDLSREVIAKQFDVNLFGPLELTNAVIKVMRQQGHGRIIFNSSILGFSSLPYRGAYNATKHAMEAIADTLRMELHNTTIKVSLIEPGPIQSRFRENALAQLKAHIDIENSYHKDVYQAVLNRLKGNNKQTPFKLGPEAVTEKLMHALESDNPKPRYYVTTPTYILAVLKRLLTTRQLDKIMLKFSGRENTKQTQKKKLKLQKES